MRTYATYRPTFEDRGCWTLPWVLRERAETHGDRVYLDVPDQGVSHTYREMLALRRVGSPPTCSPTAAPRATAC